MDFNLEIRKKQLKSLKQYIKSSEESVNRVFQSVGWTTSKTVEDKPKAICPLNKNHSVAQETLEQHLDKCSLKSAGYQENELFLSEPIEESEYSIKLTKANKVEAITLAKGKNSDFKTVWNGRDSVPITSDRLISTYSNDERLAFYDYTIKHTKSPPKPEEFTLELPDGKERQDLSEKDRLINERDAKRRRVKYKSVHTSKKSQTEIMREIIDNQMALYKDWIKQKEEQERKEKEKLRRLANEKRKSQSNEQYQYIETIFEQNVASRNETQWIGDCNNEYYHNAIQSNQGVITDWSHLYQVGADSDLYGNSDQYLEQIEPSTSIDQVASYTDTSQMANNYGVTSSGYYEIPLIGQEDHRNSRDYSLTESRRVEENSPSRNENIRRRQHSRDRRK